ncbi:MAG: hypothetical protein O2779_05795 [Nanoarchaeota archaeon]|nr:hypothetical protein [Nanoarchaeota archaeon]
MLVQKDFLSKLKDFGLNTYESKIWTALLSRGTSSAGELSDIANVPRSRSYDVLESLDRKGFITMKAGKPITYVAVAPAEVIDRIKEKLEDHSNVQLALIESIKTTPVLDELNALHLQGAANVHPVDLTGSICGRTNIYNHLISMIKKAKTSITLSTTDSGLTRKTAALLSYLENAASRGVRVTVACPGGSKHEHAKTFSAFSKVVRAKHPSRFCIVDKKETLFFLMLDESIHPSYEVAVWVATDFFASRLEAAFQQHLSA